MTFDYYVFLDKFLEKNEASENPENATGLVDLGDRCLLRARHDKKKARKDYMQQVVAQEWKHTLPSDLHLEPDYTRAFLPEPDWFAIDVSFTLKSPWYSKDDRPLHVLDNPVRKDRVFGVPFMSAASRILSRRWQKQRIPGREATHDEFRNAGRSAGPFAALCFWRVRRSGGFTWPARPGSIFCKCTADNIAVMNTKNGMKVRVLHSLGMTGLSGCKMNSR